MIELLILSRNIDLKKNNIYIRKIVFFYYMNDK